MKQPTGTSLRLASGLNAGPLLICWCESAGGPKAWTVPRSFKTGSLPRYRTCCCHNVHSTLHLMSCRLSMEVVDGAIQARSQTNLRGLLGFMAVLATQCCMAAHSYRLQAACCSSREVACGAASVTFGSVFSHMSLAGARLHIGTDR